MYYQILAFIIHRKIQKSHIKTINLKCLPQNDHAGWFSISDIQDYFEYIMKKDETLTANRSIKKYINKIENGITFKNKTGYYFELSTLETIKLLKKTENKIAKDKKWWKCTSFTNYWISNWYIQIIELILVYCNSSYF